MPGVRRALHSVDHLDTRVLTLSPQFLAALQQVAPGKRSAWPRYALGVVLLAVVAVFGAVPAARGYARDQGRRVAALLAPKAGSAATARGPVAPDPVFVAPVVVAPIIVEAPSSVAQAPVAPPTTKAPSKKPLAGRTHSGQLTAGHGNRG
jgi:hypothetical protein